MLYKLQKIISGILYKLNILIYVLFILLNEKNNLNSLCPYILSHLKYFPIVNNWTQFTFVTSLSDF